MFIGNLATSEIKGQGKVVLKMTSGKEVTLKNIFVSSRVRLIEVLMITNQGY